MSAPIAPPPPPPPAPAGGPEQIPKLLTETDVYLKYGLLDKALDHLKKVLAIDPAWPEAHERAREIHAGAGRLAEAVVAAEAAVRGAVEKGLVDRAKESLARLRQLEPASPLVGELSEALGGSTEEISLAQDDVEELVEAPSAGAPELEDGSAEALESVPSADEDALALELASEEGEAVLEDEPVGDPGLDLGPPPELTTEAELEPVPFLAPSDDELAAAASIALDAPEEIVEEAPAAPDEPPPTVVIAAPPEIPDLPELPAAAEDEDEEIDLTDELEQADFFHQQGLVEEARDALRNLLAFYPGHREVRARLEALERRAAQAAPPPTAPAPAAARAAPAAADHGAVRQSPQLVAASAAGDASFDIGKELADELDAAGAVTTDEFQYSVEDVFNQFKKGVAETVKAEDSDTHYDLGIAYKEMGLVDDAVHEFETAARGNNRKKEVDALSMIGLCRMEQDRPKEAIEALRRALRSDYLTKDASKAIHFDLGAAFEAAAQPEVALWYLQKVLKADPAFRDAARRAASLGGGPGRPPVDEAGAARPTPRPAPAPAARPAAPGPAAAPKKNIGYL